ncbi:type II and III secretion system protein family protein [Fulvimonas sp. R45]|uniref:type II and III secretion system protein family protein n=1 Tax=Fulvimonas sp. R45 TaxID=3045937 RepID=UPI00265E32E0|nr:type II and III secretion system protein family protein [Fulvimonas sp. R45]MDO1528434.1 type II and III secretion system protein family protein [Fulvimonas sp. R45]
MAFRARQLPRWRLLVAGLALALPSASIVAATADADVTLQTHEQRPWRLPADLQRIAIADPSVVDLVRLGGSRNEALLVGKRTGETTLLLWRRGDSTPQRLSVRVRGVLQRDDSGLHIAAQDGQALLSGSTPTLLDHEQARAAAADAAGAKGAVADISTVASGGVVQVDVKVVELDKTAMDQFGLNFQKTNGGFKYGITSPSGGSSPDAGSAISSAFSVVASSATHNWSATLNLLKADGMARVLAEPTLVALSGQSASFLAGGELPIPEPQGLGTTTITYKQFGIGLTVTPTVLGPDRIALKVAPEASDLDYSNALVLDNVSVPAITTRRADTTVELGDGETFVIGGLVSQSISSQVNKIPLLGDIPIIGAFFRDLRYSRQDKELVIMVTPHLVRPIARGTALPLPGQRETADDPSVWGSWLLDPAGPDQMPGFSR